MLTILIFIVILSVLVFVHEFGHFIVAKKSGRKVEEFGFGFPPKVFGIKRGETIYSLNWIPFGGFVKILGEDGDDRGNPRSFASAPARTRALILAAGVLMNFIFAFVLLAIGNFVGLRVGIVDGRMAENARDIKVQVIQVVAKGPADAAGIKPLDEIAGFRGENNTLVKFKNVEQVQNFINSRKGRELILAIGSGKQLEDKKLVPRLTPPVGEGPLGISLAETGIIKYPWYQAIGRGAQDSVLILEQTVMGYTALIKNILVSGRPGMELSGPVGIAVITGKAAKLGFTYLMQFTALISINLAVLNSIPFPALDGGRLLFIVIEKIRRRPVSRKIENAINTAGFALLVLLMIYITTKDVIKFF